MIRLGDVSVGGGGHIIDSMDCRSKAKIRAAGELLTMTRAETFA